MGKCLAVLKGVGAKRFGVVPTQDLEVWAVLKVRGGGGTKFQPFKGAGVR